MKTLHPTLWRTCKMLAGNTRIRLLRQLHDHPGECVSNLGKRVGIGEATASQELRRIQSRGFLQSARQGVYLIYRMAADPQVATAAPILGAIQLALRNRPPKQDQDMRLLAAGLAHERRIRIARALVQGSRSFSELQFELQIPLYPLHRHLQSLLQSGLVLRAKGRYRLANLRHPLAQTLLRLIERGITR